MLETSVLLTKMEPVGAVNGVADAAEVAVKVRVTEEVPTLVSQPEEENTGLLITGGLVSTPGVLVGAVVNAVFELPAASATWMLMDMAF